jgi:hypothetical protein
MRRSSRIPKEVAILLTGSDMEGKGFSEMTKTVLLSRHGAGIVSTYKLYAEQEVIVRYLDTNREAVVRVVGRIGDEGELFTYGVAFVDLTLIDFWGIDFAPVSQKEKEARRVALECATCGLRETVEHIDVESDVLMINDGIVRYCKECHDSTLWKRSGKTAEELPVLVAAGFDGAPESAAGSVAPGASAAGQKSGSVAVAEPTADASVVPAVQIQTPAGPAAAPLKQENRRKYSRMKVNYKACVRRSGMNDEIVACEDMSKGGICFKSRKKYFENTEIEVAVPYAPGGNAIFVPAKIAWVVEIVPDKQYKCGVAYRITARG